MSAVRLVIVGCGRMGHDRARAAVAVGALVVAVADADARCAAELASECGENCAILSSPDELAAVRPDALLVCTPPFARGPWECAAIRAGVPLFVEKPIALDAGRAQEIVHALRQRPVLNAVGYMNRYRPSMAPAKQALAGRTVLGASACWVGKPYRVPWWRQPERSGGPLNEQATHLVDTLRFLLGEISEVQGTIAADDEGVVSTAAFAVRLARGGVGTLLYGCAARTKMIDLQVLTADGRVRMVDWDFHLVEGGDEHRPPPRDPDKQSIFERELAAFVAAVRTGSPATILCDVEDALRTQRVVDAMREAVRTGRVVAVASE